MVDYVWKGSFVLNGANCETPINRNDWLVESIGNRKVKFTKTIIESDFQEFPHVCKKFKEDMDELLNAIAVAVFFDLNANSFPFVSDINVDLDNRLELRRSKQRIPCQGTINLTFTLSFTNAHFSNLFLSITNIGNSPYKDLLNHYLTLFRQGVTYTDSFDNFFTLWRAFNALYNFHSLKDGEPSRVEETLHLLLDHNDQNEIVSSFSNVPHDSMMAFTLAPFGYSFFQYLTSLNLTDKRGRNRSSDLQTSVANGNNEQIIKSAMLCLYVLRCNYAHGSDSDIMENQRVFEVAANYLRIVLGHLLENLA